MSAVVRPYIVTGAARGLGLHTVEALASRPNTVVFLGARDRAKTQHAAKSIKTASGSRVIPLPLDVASDDSIVQAVETVKGELAKLDLPPAVAGIVNNAGVNTENAYMHDYTEEKFYETPHDLRKALSLNFEVNAFDRPVVVNMGSSMGSLTLHADPEGYIYPHKQLAYSSTKGFLNHLTLFCSQVYPEVRFVTLHPGYLGTDMTAHNKHTADASTGIPHIISQLTDTQGETGVFLGPSPDKKSLVTMPW